MTYPMKPDEYKESIERLGLTQAEAAWLFTGKSPRSGRRWVEQGAPYPVALIIAMMEEFELTKEHVQALGRKWRKKLVKLR